VQVETRADGLGTIVPSQNIAAGTSITVYAIERDLANNFVANVAATWSLVASTGGVVAGDLVVSSGGKSAVFTGRVKGTAAIQASVTSMTVVSSGTISVIAGTATIVRVETAANGNGTLLPAQSLQSGRTLTGYAVSRDAYLNYAGNIAATWSLVGATGGVGQGDLVPGSDAKSAVFTGHKIGSAQIQATSAGPTAVPSGTITVTAGAATQILVETAADGSGTTVPAQIVPSGKSLTAYAITRDASSNFVANVAATWSLINVIGSIVQGDLVPAGDMKSAVLTGRAAGSAQIQARTSGLTTVPSGLITISVVKPTQIRVETAADGSGVVVSAQNLVATRSLIVYSIARDSAGAFIANQAAESWTLQNTIGGILAGDLVASSDGKSAVFTAHRVGSAQIKAVYGTLTAVPSGVITVIPGAATTFVAAGGTPQSATVGTAFKTPLTSAVRDSAGNGVRGVAVTYAAPTVGPGGAFAGSTWTVMTDSTGTATAPQFTANTTVGRYVDTARATGFAAPVLFQLTNTAERAAAISPRTGTPQSTPIVTAFPTRLAVLVTDRFGNPVSNVLAAFVPPSAGPSGTFPGGSNTASTDTDGIAIAPVFVANSIAGPFSLSATVVGVATPALFLLTNLPGKPGSIVATTGTPQSTTVGTPFGLKLTVIVRDPASNPVKNVLVTFRAPPSGASARFQGRAIDTVRTDSAGFAVSELPVADSVAGSYSVVASVEGVQTTAPFTLTNLPGALNHFAITFSDGDPTAVRYAGVPFGLALVALDAYDNLVTGFGGTAEITSNLVLTTGGGTTPGFSAGTLAEHDVTVGVSGTGVVTVVRSGGTETGASDSFAVQNPMPALVDITPSAGTVGYSLTVAVNGTGFLRGVTAVNFGDQISTATTIESYTRMTVTLHIEPGATTGPRDVLITNKPPGGGTSTLAGTFTVERNTYPAMITLSGQIEFPSRSKPSEYAATDYRIVGIPGGSGWSLRDLLRGSQGTDWQAYWDNGQSNDYLVQFDDGPNFRLTAGKAFWLIGRGGISFYGTVPTSPLDSGMAALPLHAGWNLITNPLPQSRTWAEVQVANGGLSEMLFAFNGAFVSSTDFKPYTGYYLFNGDGRQKLRVPYIPGASPLPKQPADPVGWRLALDLRSGTYVDRTAALGVSGDASDDLDRYDHRRPRAMGDIPSIEFRHPEWDVHYPTFATDVRAPFVERELWHFHVLSKQREPLAISWLGSGNLPAGLFLIDENSARVVDLSRETVYVFTPAMDRSPFTVVAGTPQSLAEILADVMPHEFALGANFPNPFNPSTTIPVAVPATADVRLWIFNILGEEVRTLHDGPLAAGRHWFRWDGRDRGGAAVAAGVYLCRMGTGSGEVFTRKMLLLK